MIERLISNALRQRLLIIVLTIGVAALGFWAFRQLKIEAYPDVSDTQVELVTQFPGHAAEEMEQQISIPIERAMNSLPNVMARRSRSIYGLSDVELTFAYGTDDYFARQVVLEKLRDVNLPDGADCELAPLTTPAGELYRYVVEGPGHDSMELRELQDWVITPRFLQENGVADVQTFGGLVKQYQIEVDPLKLEKYNITISQIASAVKANNQNAGGALVDNGQQSMVVRGVGLVGSIADLENIVLSASSGAPVFIRDIGSVKIGPAIQKGIYGLDSESGGIEGIVLMRRGENPSDVLKGVRDAVEDLNSTRLPPGVRLRPIYDRTELVDSTLHTVSHTLLEGLTIVFLVLFFFLGSMRAAVLTAIVIPLSLLFAFLSMYLYGIHASLLSLGALDLGIIVDGTLVMVEYIVRQLSTGKIGRASAFDAIRGAAIEIERPILFSLAILICAYLPLFTLERVERRLFTPMAFTVCSALLGSLLFTTTVVPVLATYLFKDGAKVWRNPVLAWMIDRYSRDIRRIVDHPWRFTFAAFAVTAGVLALGTHLGSEFLPQLDEGVIWIRSNLPAGTSLAKTAEIASDMRRLIHQSPEVLAGRLAKRPRGRGHGPLRPQSQRISDHSAALFGMASRKSQERPGGGAFPAPSRSDPRRRFQLYPAHHRYGDRIRHRFFGRSGRHFQRPGLENPPAIRASGSGPLARDSGSGRHQHRTGGGPGATPHRRRSPGSGALRHQHRGRAGPDRDGHRGQSR